MFRRVPSRSATRSAKRAEPSRNQRTQVATRRPISRSAVAKSTSAFLRLPQVSNIQTAQARFFATATAATTPAATTPAATPAKAPRKKKTDTETAPKAPKPKVVKPAVDLPPKPSLPGWGEDAHTPGNASIKPANKQLVALVEGGKNDEAKAMFAKMLKDGPQPNMVTYNIMIKLYRTLNDYKGVEETLKQREDNFRKKVTKGVATRTRLPRPYRPKPTSAPWSLLVALRRADKTSPSVASVGLLKEQLILDAQKIADKDISFVTPDDYNGFYSGWACMATLIEKGLVERKAHGTKGVTFSLTANGRSLADDLEREWVEIQKSPAATATM